MDKSRFEQVAQELSLTEEEKETYRRMLELTFLPEGAESTEEDRKEFSTLIEQLPLGSRVSKAYYTYPGWPGG